jgi:hypothetical protein
MSQPTSIRLQCSKCGATVIPVEGVSSIYDRGYLWHAECCNVFFESGQPRVAFPSTGKLLPYTILHPLREEAER